MAGSEHGLFVGSANHNGWQYRQRVVGIDQGCQLSEETLDVERKGKEDKGKEIKV